jgi:hypothetical protein
MMVNKWLVACVCVITAVALSGCANLNKTTNAPAGAGAANSSSGEPSPAATSTETGVEKVKPAPGTGNVQGKVFFNNKPVENIEVRLCEKFNRYFGGCSGKIHTALTDKDGDYVIANVEPKEYEGLLARVFDTDSSIFAATGLGGLSAAKYVVTADKTLFVAPTHLYRSDLKLLNPKAGSKVSAQGLALKWGPYSDASYYKFSLYPEDASITSPYIKERVEGTSFDLAKPLQKGTYRVEVEAFNDKDQKLSESADDIKFTITDGAGS